MKKTRRDFLKITGLAGVGLAQGGLLANAAPAAGRPHFNMCNYAAPALERVRVGLVGVGGRGIGALRRLRRVEGADIVALADVQSARIEVAKPHLADLPRPPAIYTNGPDDWKRLCDRPDVDLVYICTPWSLHTPMAVYAMESGKHAAIEVPAATTLQECWRLVDTSERTRRHCMMLENCCYDFFELLTLNMARQGLFGEIVHGEAAYIHDLHEGLFRPRRHVRWRLKENFRNGNLYPTHGLGPVCQAMNIGRGDQMDYLVSVSSADFQMGALARRLAAQDAEYQPFAEQTFRGNMNVTTIRTQQERTIMVQHDVTSPRPYSRIHLLSGTKGMAQKYPSPARVAFGHQWVPEKEFKELEEKYTLDFVKKMRDLARSVGGHGGMDFLMDWRLVDNLRRGRPLDQDVYDAALWSAIGPLSEQSVANRSQAVDIPDFTRGAWRTNAPVVIA